MIPQFVVKLLHVDWMFLASRLECGVCILVMQLLTLRFVCDRSLFSSLGVQVLCL